MNKSYLSLGVFWTLCLTCFLLQQSVEAATKSLAMGGTTVAYPSEADNINPATLVYLGNQSDFGGGFLHQEGKARIRGNAFGFDDKFNTYKTPYWPAGVWGTNRMIMDNLSFDIALRPFIGVKSRWNKATPLIGTTPLGVEAQVLGISPSLSWNFWKNHSLGATFHIILGRVKYDGFQAAYNNSVRPNHLTNNGYNYSRAVNYSVGYLWKVTPQLNFGIVYTPKVTLARFNKYDGLKPNGRLSLPETVNFGIAARLLCNLVFTFDFNYAKLKNIPAADHSPLRKTRSGASNGPGAGWMDVYFVTWGLEYKMLQDKMALRLGGIHSRCPIPRHHTLGTPECFGVTENALTVGGSWRWSNCMDFSFAVLHNLHNKVKGRKSIPATAGGGNIDIEYSATVFLLGVSYRT